MATKPVCLVCNVDMEKGFVPDYAYTTINIPRWCPGEPKPGFITPVKHSQAESGLRIIAYRCPQCEALRLYAPSND